MTHAFEKDGWVPGSWILGIDTCGHTGSIALGRSDGERLLVIGEAGLAGGEFAAKLLPAISGLLTEAGITVGDLGGLVAVAGPGSFTGIRIGLSTAKGIAEARGLPVVTLSRLSLLAELAETRCAVLDAYRGQLYCGVYPENGPDREMLLTAGEVNAMGGLPQPVGVCEESAAQLLENLVGDPVLVRVAQPVAADALRFVFTQEQSGRVVDIAMPDGYYLRGADAKIAHAAGR